MTIWVFVFIFDVSYCTSQCLLESDMEECKTSVCMLETLSPRLGAHGMSCTNLCQEAKGSPMGNQRITAVKAEGPVLEAEVSTPEGGGICTGSQETTSR